MKNSDIYELYNAITLLKEKKLPIKVSFVLTRNMKKMHDIVEDIDKSRIKILEKYGNKDENGKLIVDEKDQIVIPKENIDDYQKDMEEIMSYEPYFILETIPMDDIEKCDTDKYDSLTFEEIYSIERMIAERTPEEPPL